MNALSSGAIATSTVTILDDIEADIKVVVASEQVLSPLLGKTVEKGLAMEGVIVFAASHKMYSVIASYYDVKTMVAQGDAKASTYVFSHQTTAVPFRHRMLEAEVPAAEKPMVLQHLDPIEVITGVLKCRDNKVMLYSKESGGAIIASSTCELMTLGTIIDGIAVQREEGKWVGSMKLVTPWKSVMGFEWLTMESAAVSFILRNYKMTDFLVEGEGTAWPAALPAPIKFQMRVTSTDSSGGGKAFSAKLHATLAISQTDGMCGALMEGVQPESCVSDILGRGQSKDTVLTLDLGMEQVLYGQSANTLHFVATNVAIVPGRVVLTTGAIDYRYSYIQEGDSRTWVSTTETAQARVHFNYTAFNSTVNVAVRDVNNVVLSFPSHLASCPFFRLFSHHCG